MTDRLRPHPPIAAARPVRTIALALACNALAVPTWAEPSPTFAFELDLPPSTGAPPNRQITGRFVDPDQATIVVDDATGSDPDIQSKGSAMFGGLEAGIIADLIDEDQTARRNVGSAPSETTTAYLPDGTVVQWRQVQAVDREEFDKLIGGELVGGERLSAQTRAYFEEQFAGGGAISKGVLDRNVEDLLNEGDLPQLVADELKAVETRPVVERIVGRKVSGPVSPLIVDGTGERGDAARRIFNVIGDGSGGAVRLFSVGGTPVGLLQESEATPACGTNGSDPSSHCALSSVMIAHDGDTLCTGVTITDSHVLTAAHCVCEADLAARGIPVGDLEVVVGSDRSWEAMPVDPTQPVTIYPGYLEGACGGALESRRWGDLAVVNLAPGALAAASAGIAERLENARLASADSDSLIEAVAAVTEAQTMKAPIGDLTDADWEALKGEAFAFYGFGVGRTLELGLKRSVTIPLAAIDACPFGGDECADAAVREVTFQDPNVGLCEGDSGGGVFRATAEDLPGFGRWALVGIMSGGPNSYHCHDIGGALLDVQQARTIVRLDTPRVSAWLEEVTGGPLTRVTTGDAAEIFGDE